MRSNYGERMNSRTLEILVAFAPMCLRLSAAIRLASTRSNVTPKEKNHLRITTLLYMVFGLATPRFGITSAI